MRRRVRGWATGVGLLLALTFMMQQVFAAAVITSPQSGDRYLIGQTVNIIWTPGDGTVDVALSYSRDNGETWFTMDTVPDTGNFIWTIPYMEGTELARIRVARLSKPPVVANSHAFTIWRHGAPADFLAVPQSSTDVLLTWTDQSDAEQGFVLLRQKHGAAFEVLAMLPANTEQYYDHGLEPETVYTYRLQAMSEEWGDTSFAEVTAVTLSPPRPTEGKVITELFIGSMDYYVNGVLKTMDVTPIIREDRTLLPVRYVVEPLGAAISWDPLERKVTVTLGETTVEMWANRNQARVNGVYEYIDPANPKVTPVIVEPGRTLIPVRFLAESLDCDVLWDDAVRQVTLTYPAAKGGGIWPWD